MPCDVPSRLKTMVSQQVLLGVLALGIGGAVGAALFVPFVAVSYRRNGSLPLSRLLLWAAALVYVWAIWSYTLLPLPDPSRLMCAGVNLDPLAFIGDLRGTLSHSAGPVAFLRDPVTMQLLLNVALFVPLGFFVRMLGGRGIVVAALAGLATSGLIEMTQLTGVWGLYPCAYRVFDVDDLLTNVTGALLGSALALPLARRGRARPVSPAAPTALTRTRRLIGMTADAAAFTLTAFATAVITQLWLLHIVGDRAAAADGDLAGTVGAVSALALCAIVTLSSGRSIGDLAVQLRYEPEATPRGIARGIRLLAGVGGYGLLGLLPGGWAQLSLLYALVLVVAALATTGGAGLPTLLGRQRLTDARSAPG